MPLYRINYRLSNDNETYNAPSAIITAATPHKPLMTPSSGCMTTIPMPTAASIIRSPSTTWKRWKRWPTATRSSKS